MSARLEARMSARTYLGFLPWIVFAVVARGSLEGVAWGAVAAVCTAGAIAIVSARNRSVKELEIFSLALFLGVGRRRSVESARPAGLPAAIPQRSGGGGARLLRGGRPLAFQPFTEQYARELVQRKYWNTHRFNRAERRAHADVGGRCSSAIAGSQITAGVIETRLGATIFNWVLPVGLIVLGVRQATLRWSDQFDEESMGLDAVLNQGELWDAP